MTSNPVSAQPVTHHLVRPEGDIAYDVRGTGPLVVLVPGMGDLRTSYRFLTPALVAAGFTVATTDLRGHGESSTRFSHYGDAETAGDIEALIRELGVPATVVGNSLAAGAAVILAAEHPELVEGLVLVGPFVRNPAIGALSQTIFRVLMAPLWVAAAWRAYLPTLYKGQKPVDFDEYRATVFASLRRPAHAKAFSLTTSQTDHAPAEARLADVTAPTLVVMGELDPDFRDPAAEARWIGDTLHGDVVMIPESGHYPQSQQPALVASAILEFLAKATHRA